MAAAPSHPRDDGPRSAEAARGLRGPARSPGVAAAQAARGWRTGAACGCPGRGCDVDRTLGTDSGRNAGTVAACGRADRIAAFRRVLCPLSSPVGQDHRQTPAGTAHRGHHTPGARVQPALALRGRVLGSSGSAGHHQSAVGGSRGRRQCFPVGSQHRGSATHVVGAQPGRGHSVAGRISLRAFRSRSPGAPRSGWPTRA